MHDKISICQAKRSPWSVRFEEVPIWAVVQAILIVACAFVPVRDIGDITTMLVFGLTVSQWVLAGIWLVLGPGPVILRLPVAPLWALVATGLAGLENRPGRAWDVFFYSGSVAMAIVVVVLLAARLALRVRLVRHDQAAAPQPLQYRLRHLLGLILATSLLLGLGRFMGPSSIEYLRAWWYDPAMYFGMPWGLALLPMTLVALGASGYTRIGLWLTAATGWFIVVELFSIWYQYESSFFEFLAETMAIVGLVAYLATLFGLLLQRAEGYRLMR